MIKPKPTLAIGAVGISAVALVRVFTERQSWPPFNRGKAGRPSIRRIRRELGRLRTAKRACR